MEKVRCPICGKLTKKDIYCEHCGMNLVIYVNYDLWIRKINEYCESAGINYKFYKRKNNGEYLINQKALHELIYRSFESHNGPTIQLIENVLLIESQEHLFKYVNISQNMALLFGYVSNIIPGLDKFKFYWNKRAIKEGYREQIEWAINDYTEGFGVKKNKRKAEKYKELLRKQRI